MTIFLIVTIYSVRNASTGFRFAALNAGYAPKITPVIIENATAENIIFILIDKFIPKNQKPIYDTNTPIILPAIQPIVDKKVLQI